MKYTAAVRARISYALERCIGSNGVLTFYAGEPPNDPDDVAGGEKVLVRALSPDELARIREGKLPAMAEGARYCRLTDNGGLTVLQYE